MSELPFFSIIIPTYNRADLIGKAIQSIVTQTYSDWELIVIDDGSKDNTKDVVVGFNDPRIKYVWQQNQERCEARNNGIKLAQGKYICFLDSDDYYLSDRLQLLFDELSIRKFPVELFFTPLIHEKNGHFSQIEPKEISAQTVFDDIAQSVIHSQQVCAARVIFKEFLFDIQFHIGEDMELWLRIARKYNITLLKAQHSIVVVDHENRSVNYKLNNSYAEQLKTLRHIFSPEHSGKVVSKSIQNQLIGNCYFGIARFYIYDGQRFRALWWMFRSVFADLQSIQQKFRINILLKLLFLYPIKTVETLIHY
ncbi:MAG: glycosyltransferase [Bacteroidetes bacterium]|nr:glycosyltransferase [Bacteroidota bacterium]